MDDRPKPPRPTSDPSIRAAGLSRPRAASIPDANEALREHGEKIGELANVHEGIKRHNEKVTAHLETQDAAIVTLARALGVEDKLPPQVRRSNPPPPMGHPYRDPAPPKPKLETIEREASRGTAATYVTLATTIALIILEVLRRSGKL